MSRYVVLALRSNVDSPHFVILFAAFECCAGDGDFACWRPHIMLYECIGSGFRGARSLWAVPSSQWLRLLAIETLGYGMHGREAQTYWRAAGADSDHQDATGRKPRVTKSVCTTVDVAKLEDAFEFVRGVRVSHQTRHGHAP